MTSRLRITEVHFTVASDEETDTGLLGYVQCTLNRKLRLAGIALRQTAEGQIVLSFPARTDRLGQQHHYVRPLDDGAREEIEQQILEALASEDSL